MTAASRHASTSVVCSAAAASHCSHTCCVPARSIWFTTSSGAAAAVGMAYSEGWLESRISRAAHLPGQRSPVALEAFALQHTYFA